MKIIFIGLISDKWTFLLFYFEKFWKSMLKFKWPIDVFNGSHRRTLRRSSNRPNTTRSSFWPKLLFFFYPGWCCSVVCDKKVIDTQLGFKGDLKFWRSHGIRLSQIPVIWRQSKPNTIEKGHGSLVSQVGHFQTFRNCRSYRSWQANFWEGLA